MQRFGKIDKIVDCFSFIVLWLLRADFCLFCKAAFDKHVLVACSAHTIAG